MVPPSGKFAVLLLILVVGTCHIQSFVVWSAWSGCSRTCGPGLQTRHCLALCFKFPFNQQTQHCNIRPCSEWSDWGACSASCGGGQRVKHCQKNCNGHLQKYDTCNKNHCPEWSAYSACSMTCGNGTQTRHCEHHCTHHSNHQTTQTQHCHDNACPPVWSAYGACSATCGGGIKTRHCLTNCDGVSHSQTQDCYTQAPCLPVWSDYGACSVTCGSGIETRHCLTHCWSVSPLQTQDCQRPACVPEWSAYSACSVTCGRGTQTRHCTNHCHALIYTTQSRDCQNRACPLVHHATEHTCNKLAVVEALALYTGHNDCTDAHARHSETFVVRNCGAPSNSSHWVRGRRLYLECNTVTPYTPVATFDNGHLPTLAGVFVGCEMEASSFYYNLKIAASVCGGPADLLHVSTVNGTYTHFYTILW